MINVPLTVQLGDIEISGHGLRLNAGSMSHIGLDVKPGVIVDYFHSQGVNETVHGLVAKIKKAIKPEHETLNSCGYVYSADGVQVITDKDIDEDVQKHLVEMQPLTVILSIDRVIKRIKVPIYKCEAGVLDLPVFPIIEQTTNLPKDVLSNNETVIDLRVVSFGNSHIRHRASVYVPVEGDELNIQSIKTHCGTIDVSKNEIEVIFYNTVGVTCKKCGQDN
jgi:hypothetical protein